MELTEETIREDIKAYQDRLRTARDKLLKSGGRSRIEGEHYYRKLNMPEVRLPWQAKHWGEFS